MDFQFKKKTAGEIKPEISDNANKKNKQKSLLRTVLPVAIAVAIGVTGAKVFIKTNNVFVVDGMSMEPTLMDRELIFSEPIASASDLHRGDIVIVEADGLKDNDKTLHGEYIKRLIGLPGDTLHVHDGKLIINGEIVDDLQYDDIVIPGCLEHPLTLKEDEYFVMGDNRNYSLDSRVFGPVPLSRLTYVMTRELLP